MPVGRSVETEMCSSSSTISDPQNDAILRQVCHSAKMTLGTV